MFNHTPVALSVTGGECAFVSFFCLFVLLKRKIKLISTIILHINPQKEVTLWQTCAWEKPIFTLNLKYKMLIHVFCWRPEQNKVSQESASSETFWGTASLTYIKKQPAWLEMHKEISKWSYSERINQDEVRLFEICKTIQIINWSSCSLLRRVIKCEWSICTKKIFVSSFTEIQFINEFVQPSDPMVILPSAECVVDFKVKHKIAKRLQSTQVWTKTFKFVCISNRGVLVFFTCKLFYLFSITIVPY